MTKQLFIIYDKKWKDCATLLYNLLSQHSNIKSSLYTKKEMEKQKPVSREKCLYIGKDCSSLLSFNDNYNELGIQVGYVGAKAWIRCSVYDWDIKNLRKFENKLKYYTEKYKTSKEYETYTKKDKSFINRQFQVGYEPWPGNAFERLKDTNIKNKGFERMLDWYGAVGDKVCGGGYYFKYGLKILGEEPIIRKYQYLIGIFIFYADYLNDFLGLSNFQDESERESNINESEKKN